MKRSLLREWSAPIALLGVTLLFVVALVVRAKGRAPPPLTTRPATSRSAGPSPIAAAAILRPLPPAPSEEGAPIVKTDAAARIDAAWKLGTSNDPAALHPLCECLSDDVEEEAIRIACASALGRLRRAGTVACLTRHLDHWSPALRTHVRETLARFRDEFPTQEASLLAKVKNLENRVDVEAEIGDRASWLRVRAEWVAARWQLRDLQREYELLPELTVEAGR